MPSPEPDLPEIHSAAEARTLQALLLVVTLALGWILLPFYGTILWAAIIALLFEPLNAALLRRLGGRRSLAAGVSLLVVLVLVVLPLALVTASLVREASQLFVRLQSGELDPTRTLRGLFNAMPVWLDDVLDRFGLFNFDVVQRRVTASLAQGSQFIATQAFSIGQDTFDLAVSLVVSMYLAFFLLRDGHWVVATVRRAVPLAEGHKQALFAKFGTVIRATVRGNLLVAAIQGALGGLAFWFLGVGGALLWAVLMAFLSLLPAVGAALVWAPVALVLLVSGQVWQGLVLIAYGMLVIGLVDNLLRPLLVGQDTGMPDSVVMITTLGGMAVFGINGFVLGPAIAAMFIAVWHIHLHLPDDPPPAPRT